MVELKPLKPGVWLMRKLSLGAKLVALGLGVVATVAAAWFSMPGWIVVVCFLLVVYGLMAFYASFGRDLARLLEALQKTTRGDLCVRTGIRAEDELGALAQALDRMLMTLSAMVADIRSNAALVAHAGQVLAGGNRALADRTEQQAANLEETAASVEQLAAAVQHNAQTALEADQRAGQVSRAADTGAQSMARAIDSVQAIQQGARRMSEIIGVIDGIAFQTNILALNAAVEAARAGEQGRGFAVVASEVRMLAKRSSDASAEIRKLIQSSVEQVETSASLIRDAGEGIASMASDMRSVAASMTDLSGSSAHQSGGLHEVSVAVQELDKITQRNAQMVSTAVDQAQALEHRAATLTQTVAAFRLQQGTADEAVALVEKAMALQRQMPVEQMLRVITDKAQAFHDRDMYVFVLDSEGGYRALGVNPAKVGTRVQDIPGIAGDKLLHDIMAQAEQGPGWVEYDITNPTTGAVQTKMSYVHLLGEHYYLGCGVYKSLVT